MRLKYVKASRANCILCEIAEKIKLMLRPYSLARNISYNLSSYYYIFILVFFCETCQRHPLSRQRRLVPQWVSICPGGVRRVR